MFGDVHDIGKNLVNTILTNNGYTVHDLGKQVPMNRILEKAVEVDADAIGLSALLVSTSKQMPVCVAEQDSRKLAFPIVVGGAAINRDFGRRIAFLDDGARYFEPGVYYAKDAFEGLEIMDSLTAGAERREAVRLASARDAAERARENGAGRRRRAPVRTATVASARPELTRHRAAAGTVSRRAHGRTACRRRPNCGGISICAVCIPAYRGVARISRAPIGSGSLHDDFEPRLRFAIRPWRSGRPQSHRA